MSETHTATSSRHGAGQDRAERLARLRRSSLGVVIMLILQFILGMIYNLQCKKYGLDADSANQVIGAGIGLLTGQALANRNGNPIPPVEPAKQETK